MDLKYFRYFDRSKDYSIILYASSFLSILIVRLMLKEIGYKVWQLKTEFIYRLALKRYAKSLPALSLADRQIVDRLQQEGVYMTSLEKLGFASTPQMVDACSEVLSCTEPERDRSATKSPLQIYTLSELTDFSLWGNERRLLDIVQNYIGLPIKFQGIQLRREFSHPQQFGAMLWHKDGDDRRSIKVIIYLSDVDREHGPFEYIPKSVTAAAWLRFRIDYQIFRTGFSGLKNEKMEQFVPRSAWKSCVGAAGTVILVDTHSVFHHGSLRTAERSALFFVYTARNPKRPDLCRRYSHHSHPRLNLSRNSQNLKQQ